MKILVVDDDPAILRLVTLTLEDEGLDVVPARNGREALERLRNGDATPDVIVLDLEMPVMDGRTFYRELRAQGYAAPVLVLSAHGARSARIELGAQASMEKPFDAERLVDQVLTLAER